MIKKKLCRITGAGANHMLENTVATSRMETRRRFKQGMADKNLPCLF
ncbi:ribosomal protein L28 [Desulfovibrio intestinalis]|uniref:Ribosomal protein L28 n=1 Tax=Desulfovibrio intestinalis TaxID=58621 RepID=A0A7W8BYI9_9BACT|nr:ribosomal protein L28 [Desulfovibrio intestinalis]